jgi:hypothetical protein
METTTTFTLIGGAVRGFFSGFWAKSGQARMPRSRRLLERKLRERLKILSWRTQMPHALKQGVFLLVMDGIQIKT